MTPDHPILVGIFEGFSWIRCEGKGSFMTSPAMKSFADERIAAGEHQIVMDLQNCTGMDSTFMGTLAGIASRLSAQGAGGLQVADADNRNRRSLEDLGLDFLMEIDPPNAPWRQQMDTIRARLQPPHPMGKLAPPQRTRHVLEAHQELADLNEANANEFSDVLEHLEKELKEKEKQPPPEDLA